MCVFFIFFTPVESNSKCIFHPHRPPLHPTNPPTKKPIHPCYSINRWIGNLFFGRVEGAGGVEDGEDHYAYVGEYGEPEGG